jgi:hypothetical protein
LSKTEQITAYLTLDRHMGVGVGEQGEVESNGRKMIKEKKSGRESTLFFLKD